MNTRLLGRSMAAISALVFITTVAFAQTRDPAAPMLGDWKGYGQSAIDGHTIEPCWDVERVAGRRMHGDLMFPVPGELEPCIFPFDSFFSADNSINGIGGDADHIIFFSGKVRAFGDGSVRITGLAYLLLNRLGVPQDLGAFAVMQMMGGPNWDQMGGANLTGRFEGTYAPRVGPGGGCIEADIANLMTGGRTGQEPTTGLTGHVMFDNVFLGGRNSFFDVPFGVQGTVNPPDPIRPSSPSIVGMIGLAQPPDPTMPQGIIAVLIGLAQPPDPTQPVTVQGTYRLYNNVFDLFFDVFQGTNRSFSEGAFSLPAVQRG